MYFPLYWELRVELQNTAFKVLNKAFRSFLFGDFYLESVFYVYYTPVFQYFGANA